MYNKKAYNSEFLDNTFERPRVICEDVNTRGRQSNRKSRQGATITNYNISVIASSKASPARTQKSRRQ